MLCNNCGTSNRDDEKFCRGCLQPVSGGSVWQSPNSELVGSPTAFELGEYAGFWQRFAALLLDGFILWAIMFAVILVLGLAVGVSSIGGHNEQSATPAAALGFVTMALVFLGPVVYFVVMESGARGATFGKRILKIKVVDVHGERIGALRAFLRYIAHILSYITLYIGFLMQPFTERKQALHDMVSGTVVVQTDREGGSGGLVAVIVGLFFVLVVGGGILAAVAIPAYQDYVVKARMAQAVQIGNTAAKAVETYYSQMGTYPQSIADTHAAVQQPAFVAHIGVSPSNGEVRIIFNGGMRLSMTGQSLYFTPTRYIDGSFTWKCSSNEILPKLLPKECR